MRRAGRAGLFSNIKEWVRGSYGEGGACSCPQRARPCFVREVPLDGAAQRGLECLQRSPAELVSNLARVDGIARVVAGSVGDERQSIRIATCVRAAEAPIHRPNRRSWR